MDKKSKDELTKNLKNKQTILKVCGIVTTIAIVLTFIITVLIPFFANSSTVVTAGGKDIELNSDGTGKWFINIQNHGLASSKNVVLHVSFKDNAEINYGTLNCNPSCDIKKREEKNELEYQWSNLDSRNDIISLYIDIQFPYGSTGKLVPQLVEVRAEGEGIVYSYPY